MPETFDFESIARRLLDQVLDPNLQNPANVLSLVDELRLVWNARGAADLAQLEEQFHGPADIRYIGEGVVNLERAIRKLDR